MEYNKRKFNKVNNKKVLHKVKKQWIVLSSALLLAIGGEVVTQHPVHASLRLNNQNASKTTIKQQNQTGTLNSQSRDRYYQQASQLHRNIIANQINNNSTKSFKHVNNKNISNYVNQVNQDFRQNKQTVHSPKQVNSKVNNVDKPEINANPAQLEDNNAPKEPNIPTVSSQISASGLWGTSHWTLDTKGNLYLNGGDLNDHNHMVNNPDVGDTYSDGHGYNLIGHDAYSRYATVPGYIIPSNLDTTKVKHIYTYNGVKAPEEAEGLFANNSDNMSSEPWTDYNTAGFGHFNHLLTADLSGMDMSDVFSTKNMFRGDHTVQRITGINNHNDVHNYLFDTSAMFYSDEALSDVDISKLNTISNTWIDNMFMHDKSLKSLDLSNFDTRRIMDHDKKNHGSFEFNNFVGGTSDLKTITLGKNTIIDADTGLTGNGRGWIHIQNGKASVANISGSFIRDPGTWSAVTDDGKWNSVNWYLDDQGDLILNGTPSQAISQNMPTELADQKNNIKSVYTIGGFSSGLTMMNTFSGLHNLLNFDGSGMNVSAVTDISGMFMSDYNLTGLEGLKSWFNTPYPNLQSMNGAFKSDKSLQTLKGLSDWRVGHINSLGFENTFRNDTSLINILDISNWNTGSTLANPRSDVSMGDMFSSDNNLEMIKLTNDTAPDSSNKSHLNHFIFGHRNGAFENNGEPGIPSTTWINISKSNSTPVDINQETTPGLYYNTQNCVPVTINYKFGKTTIYTYNGWTPKTVKSTELPGQDDSALNNYELDPRLGNPTYHFTNNEHTDIQLDKTGKWGNASWDLTPGSDVSSDTATQEYGTNDFYLHDGQFNAKRINANGVKWSNVQHIDTYNTWVSDLSPEASNPGDGSYYGVFDKMPNLETADLTGVDASKINNVGTMSAGWMPADSRRIDISNIFQSDGQLRTVNFSPTFDADYIGTGASFNSDYALKYLDISMFKNDEYFGGINAPNLHKVTFGSDTSMNPGGLSNGSQGYNVSNPDDIQTITNGKSGHAGTWIVPAKVNDTIQYHNIFNGQTGSLTNPSNVTSNDLYGITKPIPVPNGWILVNNSDTPINNQTYTPTGGTYTYNVAPVYKGLTYSYDKNNKIAEFHKGTPDNSLANFTSSAPSDIKNASILKFDSDINFGQVNNFSSFVSWDQNIKEVDLPSNFNTSSANTMNRMFNSDHNLQTINNLDTVDTRNVSDLTCMFWGISNVNSLSLGNNYDTTKATSKGNIHNIFSDDTSLNEIKIMSPDTKFNSNSGLSNTWHQITDFDNPKSTKYPENIININDGKAHKGIWAKGSGNDTAKVNFINQNNVNIGSTTLNSVNGTITWPTTAPNGYFIDGGQETSHTIQASDVDSHDNLTKDDFNADGSHNIYVTGDKADLNIQFKDGNQVIDSDNFNGTNAIGDKISQIKLPKGYHIVNSNSLPNGYSSDSGGLDYEYKPQNISDTTTKNGQPVEQMKQAPIQVTGNSANVYVKYINSDGNLISGNYVSGKVGQQLTLNSISDYNTQYSENNHNDLNYTFKPSNINYNNNNTEEMNDYIVYVHNIKQSDTSLRLIYINQNDKQVGYSDIINGTPGQRINDITNSDDGGEPVPNGYVLNPHINQPKSYVLQDDSSTVYLNLQGKMTKPYINISMIEENNDGSDNIVSNNNVQLKNEYMNGDSIALKAKDYVPNGYSVDNSQPTTQIVTVNNNKTTPESIMFYYKQNDQLKAQPITVRYINQAGKVIKALTLSGKYNQDKVNGTSDGLLIKNNVPNGYSNDLTIHNYDFTNQPQNININVSGETINYQLNVHQIIQDTDDSSYHTANQNLTLTVQIGNKLVISPYNIINNGQDNNIIPNINGRTCHAVSGNTSLIMPISANSSDDLHDITYLYQEDAVPTTPNKLIRVHYVTSDNVNPDGLPSISINAKNYQEVDEESDYEASDSFNINPYLNDIPTNVNDTNYDLAGNVDNNQTEGNIIKDTTENNTRDIYIHVKQNKPNNNLIILS